MTNWVRHERVLEFFKYSSMPIIMQHLTHSSILDADCTYFSRLTTLFEFKAMMRERERERASSRLDSKTIYYTRFRAVASHFFCLYPGQQKYVASQVINSLWLPSVSGFPLVCIGIHLNVRLARLLGKVSRRLSRIWLYTILISKYYCQWWNRVFSSL